MAPTAAPVSQTAVPLPGASFADVRDGGRALQVSWHPDGEFFVFSLWRGGVCAGTFRLDRTAAPELIASMVAQLAVPAAAAG